MEGLGEAHPFRKTQSGIYIAIENMLKVHVPHSTVHVPHSPKWALK